MWKKICIIILSLLILTVISFSIYIGVTTTNTKIYESNLFVDKENNNLKIKNNNDIKILQLTDIQIANYFDTSLAFPTIKKLIKKTKPDLIVLTGDNINNNAKKIHQEKLRDFLDSFEIPWAVVYGNHDYTSKVKIDIQNEVYENSKYCLFQKGNIQNYNGNYYYTITKDN